MTALLEQAFREASELSDEEQNLLAQVLLEDFSAEKKWDDTLASEASQGMLESMAEKAQQDFKAQRGQSGGFGEL